MSPHVNNEAGTEKSLSKALAQCAPLARDALESVLQGKELSFEQSLRLGTAAGADLEALVAVADCLRSETVGRTITYVINRNINFTAPAKPGIVAPPKSAFRAACPATLTDSFIAISCAPSNGPFPPCTSTRFRRWKSTMAW